MVNTFFESSIFFFFEPESRSGQDRLSGHGTFSSVLCVTPWSSRHLLPVQGSEMLMFFIEHSGLKAMGNLSYFKVSGRLTFQPLPPRVSTLLPMTSLS